MAFSRHCFKLGWERVFAQRSFFDSVGNSQELGPALLFGIIVGWASGVLASFASIAFQAYLLPLLGQQKEASAIFATVVMGVAFLVLLGWLIALLFIIVNGLIVHLFLLIFGGAKQGLTMTLRVISYAYAPQIFAVVPLLGGCVALVWVIFLYIIGLASAHRTDTWRSALAVLVPIFLCICVVGILSMAILAIVAIVLEELQRPPL